MTQASVFRYVDFPELICKPIKHNGEIFYMLEVYLVTMKQENYKVETEKYIAYEKRLYKDRYSSRVVILQVVKIRYRKYRIVNEMRHRHWKSVPRLIE